MLKYRASSKELTDFVKTITSYPISIRDIINLAAQKGADSGVVDFYSSFPADQIFYSYEDLKARTELIEILGAEDQPFETWLSSEED
jgi:hypothetical protein